jgi:hypothetical protein
MNISSQEYKDIGDAIGMPDEADRKQVEKIINEFEKAHPGHIKLARDEAREHLRNLGVKNGVVDKKSARRYALEIPEPLYYALEKYIPTLFRSKKHFGWLRKNFKYLFVEV